MKKLILLVTLLFICGCSLVIRDIGKEEVKRYGISQEDANLLIEKTDQTPAEAKKEIIRIKR
jgi:hypothetical protein